MNIFDTLFGGGEQQGYQDYINEMQQALQREQQLQQEAKATLNPWMQMGQNVLPQYQNAINAMHDPTKFISGIMSNYQESPGAKYQEQNAMDAAQKAAAASGMIGSSGYLSDVAKQSQGIASQDEQNYLHNALGVYGNYLGGLGGLEGQGFSAASQYAGMLPGFSSQEANIYGNMGQGAYGRDVAHAGGIVNALSGLSGLIGSFF